MDYIAHLIAENRYLQAVAIFVAVGTLLIFLWKNVPPAVVFVINGSRKGVKATILRLLKTTLKNAKRDHRDIRLIVTGIFLLGCAALVRIAAIPLLYLCLIVVHLTFPVDKIALDMKMLGIALAVAPISLALTWFTMKPAYQVVFYAVLCRRMIHRERSRGTV